VFVAARCAACQLGAEGSSWPIVSDLEAKVAALEKEKAALQLCLEKYIAENATLSTELVVAAERAGRAEEAAKEAEAAKERRSKMRNRLHSYKEAVKAGAAVLQEELLELLEKYGLVAPEMSSEDRDTIGLEVFFKWLRACVAMVNAGAHFQEDLSAVVAVRTLSAAMYGLFPAEAGNAGIVTKAQLCSLRDEGFCLARVERRPTECASCFGEKYRQKTSWIIFQRRRPCFAAVRS
jgi:regulator of replication initiation timing